MPGRCWSRSTRAAPLTCAGYTPVDPNWYSFSMTSVNRSKELSYTVSEPYPTTGTPLPLTQTAEFCFAAPYDFTTNAGTPAAAARLPDGTAGYVGSCRRSGKRTVPGAVDDAAGTVGHPLLRMDRLPPMTSTAVVRQR